MNASHDGSQRFEGLNGIRQSAVGALLEINSILAETLFDHGRSGEPVHLDLDDDAFSRIQDQFGLGRDEFINHLVQSVLAISLDGSPSSVFGIFSDATVRWNNVRLINPASPADSPPALALLATLSLAAELMRPSNNDDEATERITAGAYYTRLVQLIGREDWTKSGIQKEYRDKKQAFHANGPRISRAIGLWQSLRDWLESWEEERGICTVAFPDEEKSGRWAVDMPVSQALLREADRDNLRKLFAHRNLDPLVPVSDEMMFLLIDEWCHSYATNHLRELWRIFDYRQSIVGAARNTLLTWSGVEDDEGGASSSKVGVGLTIDLNAFSRRVDVGVEIRIGAFKPPESIDVMDADGAWVSTRVQAGGPRVVRVADYSAFDVDSLVSGVFRVAVDESGLSGQRYPKPVVAFVASSAGSSYSEVSTTTLSARHGILVRATTEDGFDLLGAVTSLLTEIARPGWRLVDPERYAGLPTGWTFIQDVEFVTFAPEKVQHSHLTSLLPLQVESMSLAGGFRVPGRRERWLVDAPPEVLVTYPFETPTTIHVFDTTGRLLHAQTSETRFGLLDMGGLGLKPGTYHLEASSVGGSTLQRTVYLVDADTPNPASMTVDSCVAHVLDGESAFATISAVEVPGRSGLARQVRGLDLSALEGAIPSWEPAPFEPPTSPQWGVNVTEDPSRVFDAIKIEKPPPDSCLTKRGHHMVLARAGRGPAPKFVEGSCKYCGYAKRFPGRPQVRAELRRSRSTAQPKTAVPNKIQTTPLAKEIVASIPPIESQSENMWDRAFQAVCYLGTGSSHDLIRIVGQVAGGDFGLDRIVRCLSALGHIDVVLDEGCRPVSWAVGPAAVVVTSEERAHLAGFRSPKLIEDVQQRIERAGGGLSFFDNPNAPRGIELRIDAGQSFANVMAGLTDPSSGAQVVVQHAAAQTLMSLLPTINEVGSSSPRVPRPGWRKLNRWNGFDARWDSADSDLPAGAYQHIGNGYAYTFHSEEIELGDDVLSGTPATVKHIESLRSGVPLIFYVPHARILCARLGAELPGLFGRAVVALTGRVPFEDEDDGLVKYHDVDEKSAMQIFQLLRN